MAKKKKQKKIAQQKLKEQNSGGFSFMKQFNIFGGNKQEEI